MRAECSERRRQGLRGRRAHLCAFGIFTPIVGGRGHWPDPMQGPYVGRGRRTRRAAPGGGRQARFISATAPHRTPMQKANTLRQVGTHAF